MIICEDDHIFTPAYNKDYLFANIIGANAQGSELLSGGVGGFGTAVPVDTNRYWMDWFWSTQFIIIFKPLFQKILDYDFKDTDTADGVLSVLAKDKMTIYPFISVQKRFWLFGRNRLQWDSGDDKQLFFSGELPLENDSSC